MLVCSADGESQSSPEQSAASPDPTVAAGGEEKTDKKKYNWKHGSKSSIPCSFWLTTLIS